MIKYNIKNNFGIIEYLQIGKENEGKFSGLYIYRNLITYVIENESIKTDELENTIKNNSVFSEIIDEIKSKMNELKIVFNEKRKKFIVQIEKDTKFEQNDFLNDYYSKSVLGNTEIPKEDKVKMIKEDVIYLINDMTNILKILKATDEEEFTKFTKQMNLTIQ